MSETIIILDRNSQNIQTSAGSSVAAYDESISMTDYARDTSIIPDPKEPAWEVYLDGTRSTGKLLHMTGVDDSLHYLVNARLSLEIGEPGDFAFSITPIHPFYNELTPYKSTVTIYQEGVELFRGRVTGYTTDIELIRSVECEGDLAYLSDIVFPNSEISLKDRTLEEAFEYFVKLYDKFGGLHVGDARYLAPGEVSITKASYQVKMSEWIGTEKSKTEFTDARTLIDEFIDTFGGYLRTKRHNDGVVYLEYISGYTDVNEQTIYYGGNLSELTIESKPDDIFTVLIPIGDGTTNDDPITLAKSKTVTDSSVLNATISHIRDDGWEGNELTWDEGLALYGRLMKQETFDGITDESELLSRSIAYFRECIASHLGNFSIKAVDMHFLDPTYRPIYLGQKVRIISAPHGIDTANQMLTCMKIDYDVTNPEATSYEFDVPFQPLTGTFTSKYKKRQKKQERATAKAAKSAKKANKTNTVQDGKIKNTYDELMNAVNQTATWTQNLQGELEKQAGISISLPEYAGGKTGQTTPIGSDDDFGDEPVLDDDFVLEELPTGSIGR